MLNQSKGKLNKKVIAYIGLISVMLVWGISPILTGSLYEGGRNSASITSFATSIFAMISLFFICIPHLKKLNKTYLKIAIPTGLFNSTASILQKIGLQYSTPTQYAFLENLSCVIVPILLFIFIKKKPGIFTILASVICLAGSFILTGMITSGFSLGIGEILCALAGIFYGVNIAGTGCFAKKLYAPLYVFIQMCVQVVVSLITALALNFISVNGTPLEAIAFSWKFTDLLIIFASGVFFTAICWVIRTNVMKYVATTAVAIIMPFSAVVTGIVSVIRGTDVLSLNLILGAVLGLIAAILSGFGDRIEELREEKKKKAEQTTEQNIETIEIEENKKAE